MPDLSNNPRQFAQATAVLSNMCDTPEHLAHPRCLGGRLRNHGSTMTMICLLIGLTPATAVCQFRSRCEDDTLSYGRACEVGVDDVKLRAAAQSIADAVQQDQLHGAVVLVARNRKIVLHQAYGWRDQQKTQPMQPDTLFRMASNSKALTAAGLLLLVDRGEVQLDDRIGTYFPTFAGPRSSRITVRHLLTHTSGWRIPTLFLKPLLKRSREHPQAPDLLLEVARFGHVEPEQQPGTTWHYNNAGYNTIAGLIQLKTGSYQTHLQRHLYDPLGMRDSSNHESDADHSRMSAIFRKKPDGGWGVGWQPGDAPDYPFARGSGGMISTALDYAIFCQMLLNNGTYGKRRILSSHLVQESTRSQAAHIPAAREYGLGWAVAPASDIFSHSGSDGTWAWIDRSQQLIGLVFTQTQRVSDHRERFRALVNQACSSPNPER